MLTVLERPIGSKLGDEKTGTIGNSSGDALITSAGHGLSEGQRVYILSTSEAYNGFKYADTISSSTFKIRDTPTGANISYVQDADVTFWGSLLEHGWSCVHLPIAYKLLSDLHPTNESYVQATVSSFSNSNGYARMVCSGNIGTGLVDLDTVKITGSSVDGVYQVVDAESDSIVVINLAYDASYTLAGAVVSFHYNNYFAKVEIYAGLSLLGGFHPLYDLKPMELVATLKLIPDDNNEVFFSIHEILKSKINISNNLLRSGLPNDIDAFTNFFITYAEVYDVSDGTEIMSEEQTPVSDVDFTGTAVNAKLEFKNRHSGYLSDYLFYDSNNPATFLNSLTYLFAGKYFDVSFFLNVAIGFNVNIWRYKSGQLVSSTVDTISNKGIGVYRLPIESNVGDLSIYDQLCLKLTAQGSSLVDNGEFDSTMSPWVNIAEAVAADWAWSASNGGCLEVSVGTGGPGVTKSKWASQSGITLPPSEIVISFEVVFLGSPFMDDFRIRFKDIDQNVIGSEIEILSNISTNATFNPSYTIPSDVAAQVSYIEFGLRNTNDGGDHLVQVNWVRLGDTDITELLCLTVKEPCAKRGVTPFYLTWMNNFGRFEHWEFTGLAEHQVNIIETGEVTKDIFQNWPVSYGETSDTITKQTFRESKKRKIIKSQYLTRDQVIAISQIRTSPVVQIVNSRFDKRTVIVDSDSFTVYKEVDRMFTVQFAIMFTDEIPSQRV